MCNLALRFATVTLALIASALLFFFSQLDSAQSAPIDGCGRTGPRIEGGQTGLGMQESVLTVSLPPEGTFFSLPARPDEAPVPSLFICHIESSSSIVIDGRTGGEVSRTVGDPAGDAVLDQIASNTRVEAIVLTPPPNPGSPLTPPLTGDGGLKH